MTKKTSDKDLDYNVLATGSKGNAVRIGDVMIDCGISFKKMKDELYKVKTLLITHRHSDHINKSCLRSIRKNFPKITIVSNFEVAQLFPDEIDIICNGGFPVNTPSGLITPFELVHDVTTTGYSWIVNGKKVIYATDTSSMEHAPTDIKTDYFFLEANYDEHKLNYIIENVDVLGKYGYDPRAGAYRHFSVQQCKGFYYSNRSGNDAKLIELHQSSRFY